MQRCNYSLGFIASIISLLMAFAGSATPIPLCDVYRRAEGLIYNDLSLTAVVYFTGGDYRPANLLTGEVKVDMLFPTNDETSFSGAYVIFQPGAITNWHWHPAGQHMVFTDGIALTGTRDGKVIELKEGETVWCPGGLDH